MLSQKKEGMTWSDIGAKVTSSGRGGYLSKRLEDLCFSGYVTRYRQWHDMGEDFYKVTHEFWPFYLRWVAPHEGSNSSSFLAISSK